MGGFIRLPQTGLYSVNEISYKVGYKNCNCIIKLFKAYIGVTPKQYCLILKRSDTSNDVRVKILITM